jgi:hypothetical protein
VVIDSGGGYHCYWLLSTPFSIRGKASLDYINDIQGRWVGYVGGDKASKDLARVLRVPGSINWKPEYDAPQVKVKKMKLSQTYDLFDLEDVLPPVSTSDLKHDTAQKPSGQVAHREDLWLEKYIRMADDVGRNRAAYHLASQLRDDGLSELDASSWMDKFSDEVTDIKDHPYTRVEAQSVLHSTFSRPARQPAEGWEKYVEKPVPSAEEISSRFDWKSMDWAMEKVEPVKFLVDSFIYEGTITILFGDGGSKKTFLTQALGMAVAGGVDFAGLKTHQCPVLFIEEQMNEDFTRNRIRWASKGLGLSGSVPFYVTICPGLHLMDAAEGILLENEIKTLGAKLVLIDSFSDVMGGGDENDSGDVSRLFLTLRTVSKATGCAFVIIHHANKQNGFRGSSDIKNKADYMWRVASQDGSDIVSITPEKRREGNFKIGKLQITFEDTYQENPYDGKVWFEKPDGYVPDASLPPKLKTAHEYVLRYMNLHGGRAYQQDIVNNADVCSAHSARQAVYDLTTWGRLYRCNDGGKGSKAEYAIVDDTFDEE